MKLRDTTRKIISLLEEKSGYPVQVVKDASLATRGLDTNSPAAQYTLKNMGGNFSGLQLVCHEFVAFQKFAPEQNIGFDLSAEYQAAMKLFGKNGK